MVASDDSVVVVAADLLEGFTHKGIRAAVGRAVQLEIGVPLEVDAALARLYPERATDAAKEAKASCNRVESVGTSFAYLQPDSCVQILESMALCL